MVKIYRIENNFKHTEEHSDNAKDKYIEKHGFHFNDKLFEFAMSKMYRKNSSGTREKLNYYDKKTVDEMLANYNVRINDTTNYDYVYIANMCKADFLYSSVINENYLTKYVSDVMNDVDGYDGLPFVRWLADMEHNHVAIDWEKMI